MTSRIFHSLGRINLDYSIARWVRNESQPIESVNSFRDSQWCSSGSVSQGLMLPQRQSIWKTDMVFLWYPQEHSFQFWQA